MREVFVYYRVAADRAGAAADCARQFQSRLCDSHPGLRVRRMVREPITADEAGEPTWMEVYSVDPAASAGGVTPRLQAAIEDAAAVLHPFLRSERHSEVFIPCAS